MRIIGGTSAGILLKVPKGLDVRPTPDLVRQAVFNSLGAFVGEAKALELFGGAGSLSLECLSRGASRAVCVEISRKHARCIQSNFELLKLSRDRWSLRIQDVFQAISQLVELGDRFDLILADPPYGPKNLEIRSESLAQRCLDNEELPNLLEPRGLFVLGHARRDRLEIPSQWTEVKMLKHGDSIMRFLRVV